MRSEYKVRRNPRAKAPSLRVTIRDGLTVTVPKRFPRRRIEELVRSRQSWIESALRHVEALKEELLPDEVRLHCLDQKWSVCYAHSDQQSSVMECRDQLVVTADLSEPVAVVDILSGWLTHKARQHLVPLLQQASNEIDIPFKKVMIRRQKTRWGSCSVHGTISLNRSLLFFPPSLVNYVLVHELCHIRHMDHSERFWNLVTRWEPDYQGLKRDVARRWQCYVPDWAIV